MPQPIRAFTDATGQSWLVLDNGHRIPLPGNVTGETPPPVTDLTEHEVVISDTEPTDPLAELWLDTASDGSLDDRYVNVTGDTMTGDLRVESGARIRQMANTHTYIQVGSDTASNKGFSWTSGVTGPGNNGTARWILASLGSSQLAGGDSTDDLVLYRYDDTGTLLGPALKVRRAPGVVEFSGPSSVLTLASGWADFGGVFAGLYVTRSGDVVTIDCLLKPTTNITLAAQTYPMAVVPVGYRPAHYVLAPCVLSLGAASTMQAGRMEITSTGSVNFYPFNAAVGQVLTAASGWVSVSISYRGA